MELEIHVRHDTLSFPPSESWKTGNKNYYECRFFFRTEDWVGLHKFAVFMAGDNTYTVEILEDSCMIPSELLINPCVIKLGIFGTITSETDSMRISTNFKNLTIKEGAYREGITPDVPAPDIWERYFAQVLAVRDEAVRAGTQAAGSSQSAETSALEANDYCVQAGQSAEAARQSADHAKVSETNSKGSEAVASQALADLLAMLGTDVATLVDGKLKPSQIPDLSINDVFEVASTEGLLTLTAQRGDVGLIMAEGVVSDSYLLAADDPAVPNNWKKLGVSYVANAGHANSADQAGNAVMINNHRVVAMNQEQYDSAVKDPDTVYLVG